VEPLEGVTLLEISTLPYSKYLILRRGVENIEILIKE
jgi:hypothetical protein